MIKRFICVLMVIIFFAFPLTLHADVVMGNSFFYKNKGKTENRGGNFIINSPSGYVIPRDEPGSEKGLPTYMAYKNNIYGQVFETPKYNIFVFENGKYCGIEAIYLYKGEYWGVMSPNHGYQPPGWVLMDDLLMTYENKDFEKENENNFYTYTDSYDAVLSAEKIVLWDWPGSDREKYIIEDEYTIKHFTDVIDFVYKDSEGREWGKVLGQWICLSDPGNKTDIPMFNSARKPIKWSYDGNRDWTKEAEVFPSAEPTVLLPATDLSKPPSGSSKSSSVASQAISSVNSMALPSGDGQTKTLTTTILIITISSVIVIGVVTTGLVLRAKRKKAEKDKE